MVYKKGKGFDPGADPPHIKLSRVAPPPLAPGFTSQRLTQGNEEAWGNTACE